jgi:hypothetical protein
MNSRFIITAVLVFMVLAAPAQLPASDAVYLDQLKEYTLNRDGSWSVHYSHKLQINTYYAFHNLYGEDFIVYDPAFQQLKVNRSVTTMADGRQVSSPANAYNELLPAFAANVPAWNRLREQVVTHTALEKGAVIDFDYTLSTAAKYTSGLALSEVLLMNSPVQKLTFVVHVPSGAAMAYESYALQGKPVVTKKGGITTYTWTLTNLPAALREDFRLKEQQNRPRIVVQASLKAEDAFARFAAQEAFRFQIPEELKQEAIRCTGGSNSPLEKVLRLQEKVAQELNTWPVPLQYTGFTLRPAAEVWKSNGGTEAEKAVLLVALLRSVNIQADPVAVIPERYYTKKTAGPFLAERFLVKVSLQGMEPLVLSAVQSDAQDQKYYFGGKRMLMLIPGQVPSSEVAVGSPNSWAMSGSLTMKEDMSLSGSLHLELGGRLNPWLKLNRDSSYAATLPAAALGNATISGIAKGVNEKDRSSFRFDAAGASLATEKAGHVFLKFPAGPAASDGWHMTELVSTRTEPLEVPFAVNESCDLYITLPEGVTAAGLPAPVSLSAPFGSMEFSVTAENEQLHLIRKLIISNSLIPVEQYDAFRVMMNTWNSRKCREMVLVRTQK